MGPGRPCRRPDRPPGGRGENGYDSNLWLYTPGKPLRQLTAQGDVKSFVWDGSEALLFPTLRDEADKALRASGEEHTAF